MTSPSRFTGTEYVDTWTETLDSAAHGVNQYLLRFSPRFPRSSTSNSHRPQDSHSAAAISHCEAFRDARKCSHCRRGCHAASDRARLVLQQLPSGKLLRFPKRESVAGDPGVAASSERSRMAGLQPVGAIRMRL